MSGPQPFIYYVCGGRSFYEANPGRKIFEVVRCWRELGFEVEHICGGDLRDHNPHGDGSTPATAVTSHPGRSRLKSLLPALSHSISEYRDIAHDRRVRERLDQLSTNRKPALVWERSSRLHSAGLQHARDIDVPFVLEWKDHLVDYRRSLFRDRALKMETRKNMEADWVVVESDVLRQQLGEQGVDRDKIKVAHNAIDPDTFKPDARLRKQKRHDLGVDDESILVGYLGSYAFYHNADLMIRAADLVKHPGIRIVMIGDGLELKDCQELATRTGVLNRNVQMLPRISMSEVPGVLAALDVAVLPGSTDIICPIKIQEYMASKTVTVAPDYACNREVIPDERYGILFEPHNAGALAQVFDDLAVDRQKREAMATAGRDRIVQNFTWQQTWGRVLQEIITGLPHATTNRNLI
ncbi:MAG: glycosyltransferase family 4 protein [Pirellulaceae bacterium]